MIAAPPRLALDLPAGTRVSLYPLGRVSGESRGLRWPISGLVFEPAGRVGTSNAALGGAVELALDGPCILILPRRHLADAVAALTGADGPGLRPPRRAVACPSQELRHARQEPLCRAAARDYRLAA